MRLAHMVRSGIFDQIEYELLTAGIYKADNGAQTENLKDVYKYENSCQECQESKRKQLV